ncbi:peptidylprolyl isomerase, partial [bacterium]|nr:peptidylprolyl isomerase [bacterium]
MIKLTTTHGDITIELNDEKAPVSAANFREYVSNGFYDGTLFHRVIDGFMIQGGGFTEDMQQKETGSPIDNEADNGLKNEIGSIAMARKMDPPSATAQFGINVSDNGVLNPTAKNTQGGCDDVFGKVVD